MLVLGSHFGETFLATLRYWGPLRGIGITTTHTLLPTMLPGCRASQKFVFNTPCIARVPMRCFLACRLGSLGHGMYLSYHMRIIPHRSEQTGKAFHEVVRPLLSSVKGVFITISFKDLALGSTAVSFQTKELTQQINARGPSMGIISECASDNTFYLLHAALIQLIGFL